MTSQPSPQDHATAKQASSLLGSLETYATTSTEIEFLLLPNKRKPTAFKVNQERWESELTSKHTDWAGAIIALRGIPFVAIDLVALRAARRTG